MINERVIERTPQTLVAWRWKRCLGCDTSVAVPDVVARWWCENCVWQPGDHVTVCYRRGDTHAYATGHLLSEYIAHETGVHMRGDDGRCRVMTPSLIVHVRPATDEPGLF